MIAIIDYGVGNIKSLKNALVRLGYSAVVTADKTLLDRSDLLILPGVGAFGDAMNKLKNSELTDYLIKAHTDKRVIVGICLGMQLLFDNSLEGGSYKGLGLIKGTIVSIPSEAQKVPHMGWNTLSLQQNSPLTSSVKPSDYVYFVHSYYAQNTRTSDVLAETSYGVIIPAIVRCGNTIGFQFHPEKSGVVGERLLKNLLEVVYA